MSSCKYSVIDMQIKDLTDLSLGSRLNELADSGYEVVSVMYLGESSYEGMCGTEKMSSYRVVVKK